MPLGVPFTVVQYLLTFAIGLYVYIDGKQRASRDMLDALRREGDAAREQLRAQLDTRLAATERFNETVRERMLHMPTKTDLHALTTAVTELRGEVRGSINGMRHRVDSIHDRSVRIEEFVKETVP